MERLNKAVVKIQKRDRRPHRKFMNWWNNSIHAFHRCLVVVVLGPTLLVALFWVNAFVGLRWQFWMAGVVTALVLMIAGVLGMLYHQDDYEEWDEYHRRQREQKRERENLAP